MIDIGQLLRQTREAKSLSLADVEAQIRIRRRYLAALEAGDWSELPNEVVARGFLQTYARFLDIDPATLAALEGRPTPTPDMTTPPPPAPPPAYQPITLDLFDDSTRRVRLYRRLMRLGLFGLVAIAIGFVLVRWGVPFLLESNDGTPAVTATLPPAGTPATPPVIIVGGSTPTPLLSPTTLPAVTETPTPTPVTPTPTPTATPISQIVVGVDVGQRAWLRVLADEQLVFEGIAEAGFTQEFTATRTLQLRTGNAGGVTFVVNGQTLPPLGEVGAIVELLWRLEDGILTQEAITPAFVPTATPTRATPEATSTPSS
jgi:cytoskeletal protein RodZ